MMRSLLAFTCCGLVCMSCAAPDNLSSSSKDLRGLAKSEEAPQGEMNRDDNPGNSDAKAAVKPDADEKLESTVITRAIGSSGASMQVKDIALLRSSIEACMGRDMLRVSDDMLIPTDLSANPPALKEGRIRFLLAAQYTAGDDIVDKEAGNLVDLAAASRTNNSADTLTDTYLRSIETIGNVVAHNCTSNNPNCQCGSKEAALAVMNRCLPGLNPATVEMADTAAVLGAVCADGPEGMRRAIASLISSYAFAIAR